MQLFGTPHHRAAGPPTRPRATPYMLRVLMQPLEHHPTEPQGHQPDRDNTGWGFWYNFLEHHPNFWNTTSTFGTLPHRAAGPRRKNENTNQIARRIFPHLHEGCKKDMTPRHYRKNNPRGGKNDRAGLDYRALLPATTRGLTHPSVGPESMLFSSRGVNALTILDCRASQPPF